MTISLIICTKDRADQLDMCLTYIEQIYTCGQDFELIIVNNNSIDNTDEVIESYIKESKHKVKKVFEKNTGLGKARNAGIAVSSGQTICFSDDDCYLTENYLIELERNFINSKSDYGQGQILLFDPTDDHRVASSVIKEKKIVEKYTILNTGIIQGANMFAKRDVFEKVGLFNEDMGAGTEFPCEDIEWACRASLCGFEGILIPEIIIYHHHQRKFNSLEAIKVLDGYDFGRGAYYASLITLGYPEAWGMWGSVNTDKSEIQSVKKIKKLSRELNGASKYLDFISSK
jgi:glycosyltransferase involved in cell wall biosynthesis